MNTNDLWETMGDLAEEDIPHVLTKLFTIYEERLAHAPDDKASLQFFNHLQQALSLVNSCNLNRR